MPDDLAEQYRTKGYAIVKDLYDANRTDRLRKICQRIHAQWQKAPLTDNPPVSPHANYMWHLNHPEYNREHQDDLIYLLDAVADPKLIETTNSILGG